MESSLYMLAELASVAAPIFPSPPPPLSPLGLNPEPEPEPEPNPEPETDPKPRPHTPLHHTSRDERIEARILLRAGLTYKDIVNLTGLSYRQVQGVQHRNQVTPRKRSGRPPILSPAQVDELIEFVTASKRNRRMPYWRLPQELGWSCSEWAISGALKRAGFRRHPALKKPLITERTRQKRLEFALAYQDWTVDQWSTILWCDETWVTAGRHRKTYVTRRPGEEHDSTCVVEKVQRKAGWMFWGSWSGVTGKGPCLFWEKDWGAITGEQYRQRIVPLVCGWFRLNHDVHQIFMQDNAPSHTAAQTLQDLRERQIEMLSWPPHSPDLNIIENAWDFMKDYVGNHFPEFMGYNQLRLAVEEAWEAIPEEFFIERLNSMPERIQAVIAANGKHTKY